MSSLLTKNKKSANVKLTLLNFLVGGFCHCFAKVFAVAGGSVISQHYLEAAVPF